MLSKKLIGLLLAVLFFVSLLWFVLSYSWLTVSYSSDDQALIALRKMPNNKKLQEFTIQNESKTFLLRRGEYRIDVASGDKVSIYRKSLGFFRDSLSTELKPQYSSKFLGKSHLNCVKAKKDDVLFSSCDELENNNVVISATRGFLPPRQAGIEEASEDSAGTFVDVLKPYGDGFLVARSDGRELVVFARETKDQRILKVSNFGGRITSETFSASPTSEVFSVLNTENRTLLIFNGLGSKEPQTIDVSSELKNLRENAKIKIFTLDDQVLLVVQDVGAIEDHSRIAGDNSYEESGLLFGEVEQRVISVDTIEPKVEKVSKLPEGLYVQDISVSPSGDIIILPTYNDEDPLFLPGKERKERAYFFRTGISDICWKNNDSFYYVADSSQKIYQYSFSSGVSSLVYGGLVQKHIDDIQCGPDDFYFSVSLSENSSENYFFTLQNEGFSGIRVEDALPTIVPFGSGREVINVELGPHGTVLVKPLLRSKGVAVSKKDELEQLVLNSLHNKGVSTEGLRLKFDF